MKKENVEKYGSRLLMLIAMTKNTIKEKAQQITIVMDGWNHNKTKKKKKGREIETCIVN
jgi:hypothetical protein